MKIDGPLNDEQIVSGLLDNNPDVIEYFFYKKCASLLGYIVQCCFDRNVEKDELISELYIYLSDNNWYKLRQFTYKSSLLTWTGVVAIRFFQKKRSKLIENASSEALLLKNDIAISSNSLDYKLDLERALNHIQNVRYRQVIIELDIKERSPNVVADEMNTNVANLYNIRRRAHVQLKQYLN